MIFYANFCVLEKGMVCKNKKIIENVMYSDVKIFGALHPTKDLCQGITAATPEPSHISGG